MKKKSIELEYTHFIVYIYAFYGGGVDNMPDRNFHRLVIDTPYIITYFILMLKYVFTQENVF